MPPKKNSQSLTPNKKFTTRTPSVQKKAGPPKASAVRKPVGKKTTAPKAVTAARNVPAPIKVSAVRNILAPKKVAAVRNVPTPKSPAEQKLAPPPTKPGLDRREIQRRTKIAAYYKFLKRGKRHGSHYRDWQEAEKDILSQL